MNLNNSPLAQKGQNSARTLQSNGKLLAGTPEVCMRDQTDR